MKALLLLLLAVLLVGCPKRTPPPVFGAPVPKLPVVEELVPTVDENPCVIMGVTEGKEMPGQARGIATCGGYLVDDQVYEEWLLLPDTVDVWRTAAVVQHESALDDRATCTAAYDGEWTHGRECRADLRAQKWTAVGVGVGGLVVGVIVGVTAGEVREVVGTVGPWGASLRLGRDGYSFRIGSLP